MPVTDTDTATECDRCEGPITVSPRSKWTPEELEVCTECWFAHFDESERKALAQRANERRENRLAETDPGERN